MYSSVPGFERAVLEDVQIGKYEEQKMLMFHQCDWGLLYRKMFFTCWMHNRVFNVSYASKSRNISGSVGFQPRTFFSGRVHCLTSVRVRSI
jgi:hypothetical protein